MGALRPYRYDDIVSYMRSFFNPQFTSRGKFFAVSAFIRCHSLKIATVCPLFTENGLCVLNNFSNFARKFRKITGYLGPAMLYCMVFYFEINRNLLFEISGRVKIGKLYQVYLEAGSPAPPAVGGREQYFCHRLRQVFQAYVF